jgi:hypothetical protein
MLIDFLDRELRTSNIARADSYLEDPLRVHGHLIMSQPEYQLGWVRGAFQERRWR